MPSRSHSELIYRLILTFLAAHKNLQMAQKRDYDGRIPIRERTFDVGDLVYYRSGTKQEGTTGRAH